MFFYSAWDIQGDSGKTTPFCFCSYLVNRSTKLHEISTEDTSIGSKCCVKNSEKSVIPNSLTNRLRKTMRIFGFREGVPVLTAGNFFGLAPILTRF
jgi:hypothetical protein